MSKHSAVESTKSKQPPLRHGAAGDTRSASAQQRGGSFTEKIEAAKRAASQDPKASEVGTLVGVAALLARGQTITRESAEGLAGEALLLWDACVARINQRELQRKDEANATKLMICTLEEELAALPAPSKFPVPFDEFLRLVFGGDNRTDRLKVFRDFVRAEVRRMRAERARRDLSDEPLPDITDREVVHLITQARVNGIEKVRFSKLFKAVQDFRSQRLSDRSRAAAQKRWEKKKGAIKTLRPSRESTNRIRHPPSA